ETLFRGFLFRGWHRSPRDIWPVIGVTALLWALIHVQYDLYLIAQVFAYGLLLGWLRWVTGSTILTMLLNGLINFEGMLETFIAFHPDIDPSNQHPRRIAQKWLWTASTGIKPGELNDLAQARP